MSVVLTDRQLQQLRELLAAIAPTNGFYSAKFGASRIPNELESLPFTTKAELVADQEKHPPYGSALTFSLTQYSRFHQTSGTSGRPLRWLDTAESWNWMLDCWDAIFNIVGLRPDDRLFFAFSFGPFLGFWTAFEAAARRGNLCMPGGGMSSAARLRMILDHDITIVFCTPTYALRLAEVAMDEQINLTASAVRALIVAGEPGGSIPATRKQIEDAWSARVFDHNGLTEVGPVGVECVENPGGLHILESDYIAEVIDPAICDSVPPGRTGELVLTNLGRIGSPVVRYRTGDLVSVDPNPCPCGRPFMRLAGGILGRTDDMIHMRGNNVYPSSIEAIIRRFEEVAEYRVIVDDAGPLAEMRIEVETVGASGDVVDRIHAAIRDELLFRADVSTVARGTLPRFEMKSKRVHYQGTKNTTERPG